MKNIYITLLLVTLLTLGFASAILPSLKEAPGLKSGVEISDSANIYPSVQVKDWLGFGADKADLILIQHDATCGIDCSSQFQITTYQDSPLIDNVDFYIINDDGSRHLQDIRSYQFYIKIGEHDVEIPDYENQCINMGYYQNGSQEQSCSDVQVGSHTETLPDWKVYNLGEVMPSGEYIIKLEGKKRPDRTVDWQITTQGKTITDWSLWGTQASTYYTHGQTMSSHAVVTNEQHGVELSFNQDALGLNITLANGIDATTAYIYNSTDGTFLAGNFTIINLNASIYYNFKAGQNYDIVIDKPTIPYAYNEYQKATPNPAYPINDTYFNWTTSVYYNPGRNTVSSVILDIKGITLAVGGSSVTLNSPIDNYKSNLNSNSFNCSANIVGGASLTNISYWDNSTGTFSLRATNILTGTSNNTLFTRTLSDGSYIWNCQGGDTDGAKGFANQNRTILVDTTSPIVNIYYPKGIINGLTNGQSVNLNFSASDIHLDTCWVDYNGINTTIPGCTNTSFTYISGVNSIKLWANDTAGNLNNAVGNWVVPLIINSVSFNNNSVSGSSEPISINITYSPFYTGITTILNYNQTNYTLSTSDSGYTKTYSTIVTPPKVLSTTNISFKFFILLTNSTNSQLLSSQDYNQTVSVFLIDNCSTYTQKILNFSMIDEESLTPINGTILTNVNIYSYGTRNLVSTYNGTFNYLTGKTSAICLANLTGQYSLDYTIQHYGNTSYFKKYRTAQNQTISNSTIPHQLALYNLLTSSGYPFKIIVVGNILSSSGNSNLLVETQKQYLAQNTFNLVESSVTDSNGETIAHLVPTTEKYTFVISYMGQILGTFNNYQVQCQNPSTGQCSITLNLAQSTTSLQDFTNYGNITQVLIYDNTTNLLSLTYSSTDGNAHTVRQVVLANDNYGNTTLCDTSSYGTSGAITCIIPANYQTSNLMSQTYTDGNYISNDFISLGIKNEFYGTDLYIEILLFTTLVLLFLVNPILIVLGAMLGILISIVLIWVSGGALGAIISTVIYFIVAGGIILWRLGNRQ